VTFEQCSRDLVGVEDEFHELWDHNGWTLNDILVTDDVARDVLFHPSIVEVPPHRNLGFEVRFPM
jgi:hypothetical protein